MDSQLKVGIKCKACDRALNRNSIDVELCNECMGIVMDCNKDLIDTMPSVDFEKEVL